MNQTDRFVYHRLDNGLRVVVDPMPAARSVAMGFLVHSGSRDEPHELAGAAHFCEHMCFKGTANRSWHQITIDFDTMGSSYNAYTSKDRTFYYGWVRPDDWTDQLALLADMMRSTFPADQFDLEKQVILEEIAMADDRLDDLMIDLLHESVFAQHGLGWPVLGHRATIEAMTRDSLFDYYHRRYDPTALTLLIAGAVDGHAAIAAANQACDDWHAGPDKPSPRQAPAAFGQGVAARQVDQFTQQGVALAFAAPAATGDDAELARATATILGGANSRFYWNIVQAGVAPRAGAWWADYHDCGLMVLFGAVAPDRADALLDAMQAEVRRMADDGVADHEVQRVANRRRTGLAAEAESPSHRLGQMVDDMDLRGRLRTVDERLEAVEAVTAERIGEYLQRWPMTGEGYVVSVGPRDWPGR